MCSSHQINEPVLLCPRVHREANIKALQMQKGCEYRALASWGDCWLECHTLREINEFYCGGWKIPRALCTACCFPFLFIDSCIRALLSLCVLALCWCRGKTAHPEWDTRSSQCARTGKLCRNCRLCPHNSLISWARCRCCCLSARLAAAALISAYLNGELITSSQFSLRLVHHCLNPQEDPSILGKARAQKDDSQSVFTLWLTTHRYTYLHHLSVPLSSVQNDVTKSVSQWFSGLFDPLSAVALTTGGQRCDGFY